MLYQISFNFSHMKYNEIMKLYFERDHKNKFQDGSIVQYDREIQNVMESYGLGLK